jgi:chromosome segregation ATPase
LAGERGEVLESLQSQNALLQEHLTLRDQQLDDLRILAGERARELESAQAQIAYLTGGLDELNSEANEKFEALQAAQKAHETALTRITELEAEQERLKSQLAVALQCHEALAVETASLHDELSNVLENASDLQEKLSEAQTQIAQLEEAQAMAADMLEAQAGEIIALSNEHMQSDSALKLAEARVSDLTTAITSTQATLASTQCALDTLQWAHTALLAEKAAIDDLLQVQAGEIDTLANLLRQREAELAQAEASMAQLNEQVSKAGAQAITLEAALLEKTTQLEQAQVSLGEMRQAQALMLQEHDALRQTRDALEQQTRNQMETLVEMSNEAAAMQQLLGERESALKAAQAALDDAQQVINARPEPGTVEARLIDVTLTLQRLESEYAALQIEKGAIEDEYTREQIAGQLRMQAKEVALRDCGSRVDALELEIALMKAKGE